MNSLRALTPFLRPRNQFVRSYVCTFTTPHILAQPVLTRRMATDASNKLKTHVESESTDSHQTSQAQQSSSDAQDTRPHAPLPLPEPTSDATQLNVNGEGVKLDHLGPLVVNKDGTLSRIANWDKMAEIEKQNTLRVLGKRNQLRLGDLRGGEPVEGK